MAKTQTPQATQAPSPLTRGTIETALETLTRDAAALAVDFTTRTSQEITANDLRRLATLTTAASVLAENLANRM